MSTLRLLFVGPLNAVHTGRWIGYFVDRGHEVSIVDVGTGDIEDSYLADRITWAQTDHGGQGLVHGLVKYARTTRRLRRILSTTPHDIVHVHGVGSYSAILSRISSAPVVVTPWGSDVLVEPQNSVIHRRFVSATLRHATAFTVDGDHLIASFVNQGVAEDQVTKIMFGTNTATYHPRNRSDTFRMRLLNRYSGKSRIILSMRQLKPVYDIATLIRAVPIITQSDPSVLCVIGSDGPERMRLDELTSRLGLEHDVLFLGRVSESELATLLASSDVYVSTSTSDAGLAASTAEAMSSGVPVVVTDFGDNPDWVIPAKAGAVFPIGDEQSLAERILDILSNTDEAISMGRRGRDVILSDADWATEMGKVERLYETLAHQIP